ncbi:LON peptidase substrate-binding domain-containing protein [Robbsia andropogonis]|nr:LON peptidase substrate-binding domain-containing protein [Robbsia andropogonis]
MTIMATLLSDLPLFPLGTVLFPEGLLSLRVFEARYLDMARDCLRRDAPFGVCLLKSGSEVSLPGGDQPEPEPIGCLAQIVNCDVQQLGVLLLRCRGSQRFRVISTHVEKDGLLRAVAEPLGDDTVEDDSDAHRMRLASCSEALSRIIDNVKERDPNHIPFLEPFRLDDASWVANRLSEVLPISIRARQQLMELDDAGTRLELVHQYMMRHQML